MAEKVHKLSGEELKQYRKVVYALVATQLNLEAIDEIKHHERVYKNSVKRDAKRLEKGLETIMYSNLSAVYEDDETSFQALMEAFDKMLKWIVKSPYHHIISLADALEYGDVNFISKEQAEAEAKKEKEEL